MANQIINVGTAANSGGGDPLRTAMIKINENFSELYTDITELQLATGTTSGGTIVVNAIQGSVIGEDSTVIVDASTSTVDAGRLTGTLPAIDGSALTGVTVSSIPFADVTSTPTTVAGYGITDAFDGVFASLTSKPTTLAGYGIADAYTQTQVDTAITNATSSIVIPTGSTQSIDVVAQDSTVLVDSVNGTLNATTLTGALPAIDGSALTNLTIPTQSALDDGLGVATVTTSAVTGVTIGGTAGITLIGAASASIDIGGYPSGTVTIGSGTNTVDYPSGTTVDFTGATVTGLNVTGDISGSVYADDSTLLVDGVNGTLNSSALTKPIALADNEKITFGTDDDLEIFHNSSNGNTIIENNTGNLVIKGSNLFLQSATSEYFFRGAANGAVTLYYDDVAKFETTADGISVTDHIALADDGELRLGTDNDMQISHSGTNGLVKSVTGTLVLQGPTVRIQDSGSSQTAFSAADGIATLYHTNTAVLNTTAGGIQIEQGVEEKFATLTGSTGVVTHDCDNGHVFYHTGATGDITANFTNLNLTAEYATNVTVVIDQGGTEYEITAVQIGGVAQTIVWQGNSAPTGTANGVDSFSFTILNDGGTYVVLGQMVAFGGV